MHILITGAAGFIGSALALRLLERGERVTGLDNLNDYYDVRLKEARLARAAGRPGFEFVKADITDAQAMQALFRRQRFDAVAHLAAQAGVRYSIDNPQAYIDSNLVGFGRVLEGCRHGGVRHLVYASSSSVYGANRRLPFSEHDNVDHPVALYAATKKANELIAHCYAHLYGLACTGLRFFTVYGPWGRPDMALFKFTRGILAGEALPVFNHGKMFRDFTYIDDIVEGVARVIDRPASSDPLWNAEKPDSARSSAPWRLYNIGNGKQVELMAYIRAIENALGMKAKVDLLPMQAGDVYLTHADTTALEKLTGFKPKTSVEEGVKRFVEWYRGY